MLAAVGLAEVAVCRRPRWPSSRPATSSWRPASRSAPGQVYDCNAAILCAAVDGAGRRAGAARHLPRRPEALVGLLERASRCDIVLPVRRHVQGGGRPVLSGGRPARPIPASSSTAWRSSPASRCASRSPAASRWSSCRASRPRRSSPSTTSSPRDPRLRRPAAGRGARPSRRRWRSARPRSAAGPSILMVSLVETEAGLAAYPTAKGSGSVTAFSQADGFVAVPAQTETCAAGTAVEVQLIGRRRPAGRPRADRQPLRRPGPAHRPARARGARGQGAERRQHGRPGRGPARRVRPGRRPSARPGDRPLQPPPARRWRPRAGPRLPPAAGHRLPRRRPPLRGGHGGCGAGGGARRTPTA